MIYPVPAFSVVIRDAGGRVLLTEEERFGESGLWIPGGALAGGTSWREGVAKVLTSHSLPLLEPQLVGVYSEENRNPVHALYLSFRVDVAGTPSGHWWYSIPSLPSGIRESEIQKIRDAMEFEKTPFVR